MPTGNSPVCCYVRDNGAGFDPLFVSKLFQPFQRLHSLANSPAQASALPMSGRSWNGKEAAHGPRAR